MSVCLCNLTADSILELAAQNKVELEPASPDPSSFVANTALVVDVLAGLGDKIPTPIELLVGNARSRRAGAGAVCHVWNSALPSNSFLAIDEGVYVASPELTLLQQARQLHQASLCQMLGRYLGTWSPASDSDTGQVRRAPLTTFGELNSYLAEVGRDHGKGNLKFAMAYTCDGSASAAETSLQLALSLPPELHGLWLPQPTMNYEVGLSEKSKALCGRASIRIDLCWRNAGFGLEYQGEGHGNQLGEDYARWFAAREEGFELWFMAKEQLGSAMQMSHVGREVAKRIDHSVNEELWPKTDELQELLDILLGRMHPKPIGYDELRRRQAAVRAQLRKCGRQ